MKDIENEVNKDYSYGDVDNMILARLKPEAIKWLNGDNLKILRQKFLHSTGPFKTGVHEFSDIQHWTTIEFANFVMSEFLNITEEDLE